MTTVMWIVIGIVALLFAGLFIVSLVSSSADDFKNKSNKQEVKGDIP